MKTKQITNAQQLVGLKVGSDKGVDLAPNKLNRIATDLGFDTVQIREINAFYDCMYDTKRLQVHVDESGTVTAVRPG